MRRGSKHTAAFRRHIAERMRGNTNRAMWGRARRIDEREVAELIRTVGLRIKAARIERDVAATELAAATGIHPSTLAHIATGKKPNVTLRTLVKVALALGITLEELIA